jgi:hypothetical protein
MLFPAARPARLRSSFHRSSLGLRLIAARGSRIDPSLIENRCGRDLRAFTRPRAPEQTSGRALTRPCRPAVRGC